MPFFGHIHQTRRMRACSQSSLSVKISQALHKYSGQCFYFRSAARTFRVQILWTRNSNLITKCFSGPNPEDFDVLQLSFQQNESIKSISSIFHFKILTKSFIGPIFNIFIISGRRLRVILVSHFTLSVLFLCNVHMHVFLSPVLPSTLPVNGGTGR